MKGCERGRLARKGPRRSRRAFFRKKGRISPIQRRSTRHLRKKGLSKCRGLLGSKRKQTSHKKRGNTLWKTSILQKKTRLRTRGGIEGRPCLGENQILQEAGKIKKTLARTNHEKNFLVKRGQYRCRVTLKTSAKRSSQKGIRIGSRPPGVRKESLQRERKKHWTESGRRRRGIVDPRG